MKKPSAVVFDLGKVLVDFDYSIAARKFAAQAHKTPDEIRELIDHSPLLFEFEHGHLTKHEFYQKTCEVTGFCGNFDDFSAYFSDIFEPITEMVNLHEKLRHLKIPTYIFSNTNELAIAHISSAFPFFNTFDDYILSYKVGVMKPHPDIYEVVEQTAGRNGSQIVYLDDRPENVASGKERGWHAITHHSPSATIKQLQDLGLPVS